MGGNALSRRGGRPQKACRLLRPQCASDVLQKLNMLTEGYTKQMVCKFFKHSIQLQKCKMLAHILFHSAVMLCVFAIDFFFRQDVWEGGGRLELFECAGASVAIPAYRGCRENTEIPTISRASTTADEHIRGKWSTDEGCPLGNLWPPHGARVPPALPSRKPGSATATRSAR